MNDFLEDGQGRIIEYLRVSVTDRCDLRCSYCMPPSGVELLPRCEILRYKDLLTLIGVFAELGVRKTRFTGGEPLIRKGIVGFLRQVKNIPGIEKIAVSTNGTNLGRMAGALREAGVSQVNISLDSLKRRRFARITGKDSLEAALEGVRAAVEAGFDSVKLNMVVMGGVNDDEVEDFARLTLNMPIQARFIEFMPATPKLWGEREFVPMEKVKERVERMGKLAPCSPAQWGGPAKVFKLPGAMGEVGFISAVSRHFCGECNRVRLTSAGALLTCLFGEDALDLKKMLRAGADKEEIKKAIVAVLKDKNAVRNMWSGREDAGALPMSRVGG